MEKKVKANLIYNPTSGQIWSAFKPEFVRKYLSARGWDVTVSPTRKQGDGEYIARKSVKEFDVVIAAGGDGTINEVVQGLAGSETVMAILPVGTTNVLARELKIPLKFEEALKIIPDMNIVSFDLGKVNGRYFLLMLGIGFDAQLVNDVDPNLKKITGFVAFAATSPVSILKNKMAKMSITFWDQKGKKRKINRLCFQILISNAATYATDLIVSHKAVFNDGLLDVDIFKSKKRFDFAVKLLSIALRKKSVKGDTENFQAKKIHIKSLPPMPIQVDGDFLGYTPAEISVNKEFIKIIEPPAVKEEIEEKGNLSSI